MNRFSIILIFVLSFKLASSAGWPELPIDWQSKLEDANVTDSIDIYNAYAFSLINEGQFKLISQIIRESQLKSSHLNYYTGISKALDVQAQVQLFHGQFDSAQANLYESLRIKKDHNLNDLKAFSFYDLANLLNTKGFRDSALAYYDTAETLFLEHNNSKYIAAVNNSKALVNKDLGNISEAINQFSTASKYMREIGDLSNLSVTIGNLGLLYSGIENHEEAKKYLLESIMLAEKSENHVQKAKSYMNLGTVYKNLLQYDSALIFMRLSLGINEEIKSIMSISNAFYNIGTVFQRQSEYDSALVYFNKALSICEEINFPIGIAYSKMGIAEVYTEIGKLAHANKLLNEALIIGEDLNALSIITNAYKNISLNKKMGGDYKSSLDYYERYISLKDSMMDVENRSTIEELKLKYETDIKDTENMVLKAQQAKDQLLIEQKNILFLLSGMALIVTVILIVILFVVYRRSISKNHILAENKADLELKNLEFAKLNVELKESNQIKNKVLSVISHDMRSPLNSLKGGLDLYRDNLISDVEFRSIAEKISQNLSTVLTFSENLLFWAKKEMQGMEVKKGEVSYGQIISDTLDLYKNDILSKNIQIEGSLIENGVSAFADKDHISIVIRNLISNSIKFSPKNSKIKVEVKKEGQKTLFSLEDQGRGIESAIMKQLEMGDTIKSSLGTQNEKGLGLGLTLCRNYLIKNGSELQIENGKEKGTKISFILPLFENVNQ